MVVLPAARTSPMQRTPLVSSRVRRHVPRRPERMTAWRGGDRGVDRCAYRRAAGRRRIHLRAFDRVDRCFCRRAQFHHCAPHRPRRARSRVAVVSASRQLSGDGGADAARLQADAPARSRCRGRSVGSGICRAQLHDRRLQVRRGGDSRADAVFADHMGDALWHVDFQRETGTRRRWCFAPRRTTRR